MTVSQEPWVIVVGAGPAGLLLSLLLAKANVPVLLLDKETQLDSRPRATHYAAPAMSVLQEAGVVPDMAKVGFHPGSISWRTLDGKRLTGMDHTGTEDDPDRMICLPLDQLGRVLLNHLEQQPSARVLWGHEVVGLREEDGLGKLEVETPEGRREFTARYVAGCDGANSKIRRLLFGDWEFPGKTWDVQVVATNVYYDFHQYGYDDANFIIHPEHWYMAARITTDGMWRVSYGVPGGLTEEELKAQQPTKWQTMLPGAPTPDQYRITNFSPYKVHQRLAQSMRVGPFLLAADAAHLCNPFGGLGLTGGIVDVGGLFECLIGIYRGKADENILDLYSQVRRAKYNDFINPISSENILRLHTKDPKDVVQQDPFFIMIEQAKEDKNKMRELVTGLNVIKHDFTQYYKSDAVSSGYNGTR